ncbi:MAG: hypothetical protein ACXV5J_09760 [Candidatus Angelobacter sp.]
MASAEMLRQFETTAAEPSGKAPQVRHDQVAPDHVLLHWVNTQALNLTRHAAALRPFKRDEFGSISAAPTAGHIEAVNKLITGLRRGLLNVTGKVNDIARVASRKPATGRLQLLVDRKEKAHNWVQGIEKIWDFYFELFGQRQTRYANWLLSCDRIALDCYRAAYLGLGVARSIPAPPPFSYMRTGFSPATFRRAIPLTRLGKQLNPFPLVQLPYHRLINPWTLGAVLHEISHNLQTDLGLARDIPRKIALRLLRAGLGREVASVWTRWNREMFADMSALLLGGPEVVGSLMDVIGRGPQTVVAFSRRGVHPTPYLRMLNSLELLRRMGFEKEAQQYGTAWKRIYPSAATGSIPAAMLKTFPEACKLAVDTMCYQPYRSLGNKSMAQVITFGNKEKQMIEEAAQRLAAGTDPGIIPERFVIGAARHAMEHRMARPGVISTNFYKTLASG